MLEPYKSMAKQKRMFFDYSQRQHEAARTVEPSIGAIDSAESIYTSTVVYKVKLSTTSITCQTPCIKETLSYRTN